MTRLKSSENVRLEISPLKIDNLNGRMLTATSQNIESKREILLIYGQHASLERMQAFAEELSQYGRVMLPDLPGFGGMDSLYKIGREPSLETMADYLATFIRLRYNKRQFTIVGVSYGFLVATRMLQKYPDIAKRVDLVASLAGFASHEDFLYSKKVKKRMRMAAQIMGKPFVSWFIQHALLKKPFIKMTYWFVKANHSKMKDADKNEFAKRTNFESVLWKKNDFRTRMRTGLTMLYVDLCKVRVPAKKLQIFFIAIKNDQYFDNYLVEQHLNVIFENVKTLTVDLKVHMPTVVATAEEVAPLFPQELRNELAKPL